MNKILQITSCRPELFWKMLASLQACPQLNAWNIYLHAQDWPRNDGYEAWHFTPRVTYMKTSGRESIYQSRATALADMRPGDVWCFGDDDMLFLPETDYDTPADFIQHNQHVGVVACNFKQFPSTTSPPTPHLYKESPMIGVMGGMLIGYESARLVREFGVPGKDYAPDDIHIGAACYVAGKMNYLYHGSLCVHSWGMPGGAIEDQRAHPWQFRGHPDYFMINPRKKYHAGRQFKLEYTERAHAEHAENAGAWVAGFQAPTALAQV